jgi:UDP-MurNAc hydroxylase
LSIEHGGVRVVSDPWLVGSCYWRSWWNLPEPPRTLVENLAADYIYLTHLHWDHFHGPSLRRLFPPSTPVLVPKVPTRRMVSDLEWLGFKTVIEIPHGTAFRLGEDFSLWSYQFGPAVDSAMVVTGGGVTLFNCNDCKAFGLPLAQITRRFPKIDFALRSHSSASPLPYCIEGHAATFAHMRSQRSYVEEFSRFALHIDARHAVPFASNHCFLHRETFQFNRTSVSPDDVRREYDRLAGQTGSDRQCVVMAPGSSWSQSEGFQLVAFDYSRRDTYVEELRERHAAALEEQYARESQAVADFEAFESYFTAFLAALPWIFRPWLRFRVAFRIRDAEGERCWVVDLGARKITVATGPAPDCVTLETPAVVVNDCTKLRMFSVWGASKRLRIHLPSARDMRLAMALFSLLDLYELETLPLARNFTLRSLGVRLRRWRDVVEGARIFFKHVVLRRPIDLASLYPMPERASAN